MTKPIEIKNRLQTLWHQLYPEPEHQPVLSKLMVEMEDTLSELHFKPQAEGWYKDAVVYSLYIDLFNHTFDGLIEKLDMLKELGINCLWLLPLLESPMRDAGFDIKDYRNIRASLLGLPDTTSQEVKQQEFRKFLTEAHDRGIRVIFDVAMNHTSEEHPWFVESRKGPDNPYRDYYIWNKDTNKYQETRLLFKGMCPSNWEKSGDWYFFHRFFEFQPDLNYKNPQVMLEICRVLLFWLRQGLDGFRADAIPYLWKEEGTDCENLPQTHVILKIFRALLDYVRPNTLLLAEACQPPVEVVRYFGNNDECHAGYHFPLMPMIFKSLAVADATSVMEVLSPEVTPEIPADNQWFLFLRLHDELTLEMVTPEDRKIIHDHYCKQPHWDFRVGEGISARLAELLDRDERKIALAYSIMFTLPGTPVIYYGDEFARLNDDAFYHAFKKETGKDDSRYLVRGPLNWDETEEKLSDKNSLASKVNKRMREMLAIRNQTKTFGRGQLKWVNITLFTSNPPHQPILGYYRIHGKEQLLILQNLSDTMHTITRIDDQTISGENLFTGLKVHSPFTLKPFEYVWIKVS